MEVYWRFSIAVRTFGAWMQEHDSFLHETWASFINIVVQKTVHPSIARYKSITYPFILLI